LADGGVSLEAGSGGLECVGGQRWAGWTLPRCRSGQVCPRETDSQRPEKREASRSGLSTTIAHGRRHPGPQRLLHDFIVHPRSGLQGGWNGIGEERPFVPRGTIVWAGQATWSVANR